MGKPRLLLGDDHRMFLEGIRCLLSTEFDVVDAVTDGRALLRAARSLRPDVVISDLTLPDCNGLEVSRSLLREDDSWRIILLTMHADPHVAACALESGVKAYLVKEESFEVLGSAIYRAIDGRPSISPSLDSEWLRATLERQSDPVPACTFELTPRQKEVLGCLAEGLGSKEVAARLGISAKTVEFHKYAIMERLGTRTSAGLLRYASVLGLSAG